MREGCSDKPEGSVEFPVEVVENDDERAEGVVGSWFGFMEVGE